jgi:hypothetical protein
MKYMDQACKPAAGMSGFKMRVHWMLRISCAWPIAISVLSACVSGAPSLNDDQEHKLSALIVYPLGQLPSQPYTVLATISSADCSGSPMGGRVTGNVDRAMDTLKRKAAAINADSIIDTSCGVAPMLNNCWAAQRCTARAIAFAGPAAAQKKSE